MSTEEIRQEFEAWWRREMNNVVMGLHRCKFPMKPADFIQPYSCHETQRSWLAWQASRAAVVVDFSACNPQHGSYNNVNCYAINDVRVILKRHGLEMKP